jgi:hypothetical protein
VPRELGTVVHRQRKDLVDVFREGAFDDRSDEIGFRFSDQSEAHQLRSAFDHADQRTASLAADDGIKFPVSDTRLFLNDGRPLTDVSLGFMRVGCAPCINSSKDDILNWVTRFPEMTDKVCTWEQQVGRTFFAPCVPGMTIHWIDDVIAWSKIDRGGRQNNLFPILPAT